MYWWIWDDDTDIPLCGSDLLQWKAAKRDHVRSHTLPQQLSMVGDQLLSSARWKKYYNGNASTLRILCHGSKATIQMEKKKTKNRAETWRFNIKKRCYLLYYTVPVYRSILIVYACIQTTRDERTLTFYSARSGHYHPPCLEFNLSSIPSTRPSLGFGSSVCLGGPWAGGIATTIMERRLPLKQWITRLHLQHLLIPGGYRSTWRDTHQWAWTRHTHAQSKGMSTDESVHINITRIHNSGPFVHLYHIHMLQRFQHIHSSRLTGRLTAAVRTSTIEHLTTNMLLKRSREK